MQSEATANDLKPSAGIDVSIVIVSWNTRQLLWACLQSIFDQMRELVSEVFVIDNASRDGSAEMVLTEFPAVQLMANAKNLGFAAANNQGIRRASGRYILLLNPDTIILDAAIAHCVRYADAHPDIGVLGCQVLEDIGADRIQRTGFSFPDPWNLFLIQARLTKLFPRSRLFAKPELGWWDRNSDRDLDVISGMFMLVRKEALEQVGLMDEAYFVYGEEADWCYRFRQAGWRRFFTTCARIVHFDGGSKSTEQIKISMYVQLQKSILIYHRKNLGFAAWLVAKAILVVSNAVRAAVWRASSVISRDPLVRNKSAAAMAALRFHLFGTDPR